MCRKSDLGYRPSPYDGLRYQIYEQLPENLYYYDVPNFFHDRIVSTEEQEIILAKEMFNSGKWVEEVVEKTGVIQIGPCRMMTRESIQRERERLYEKARHDEAQALYHAKRLGIAEAMLAAGAPIDKIMNYTKLSKEEIEDLR